MKGRQLFEISTHFLNEPRKNLGKPGVGIPMIKRANLTLSLHLKYSRKWGRAKVGITMVKRTNVDPSLLVKWGKAGGWYYNDKRYTM